MLDTRVCPVCRAPATLHKGVAAYRIECAACAPRSGYYCMSRGLVGILTSASGIPEIGVEQMRAAAVVALRTAVHNEGNPLCTEDLPDVQVA